MLAGQQYLSGHLWSRYLGQVSVCPGVFPGNTVYTSHILSETIGP